MMDVYWILYTMFAFCVGPPLALFGYKLFKPMFAIVGFLCGFAVAVGLMHSFSSNPFIVMVGGTFGGLAGLLIANVCAFALIYLLGFQVGALIIGMPMMFVFKFFGIDHVLFLTLLYIVAIIAGLIGGTYATTGKRVVVIAWSSLTGALFVVFGLMMVLYHTAHQAAPASLGNLISYGSGHKPQHLLVLVIGIVLFIDSMRYQFRSTKGMPELDLSNPFRGLNTVGTSSGRRTKTRRF
jgi:hypothetical protein